MPSFGVLGGAGSTGGEDSDGALAQYSISLGVFAAALIFALLFIGVNWLVGYVLYKKKIYIKI